MMSAVEKQAAPKAIFVFPAPSTSKPSAKQTKECRRHGFASEVTNSVPQARNCEADERVPQARVCE